MRYSTAKVFPAQLGVQGTRISLYGYNLSP